MSNEKHPDEHPDHSNDPHDAPGDAGEISGLGASDVFPFFFLAFAVLGTGFLLVSWGYARLDSLPLLAVPAMLGGVASMLLCPVIGYWLSLQVWAAAEKFGAGATMGVLCVLAGAVCYQGYALAVLKSQVVELAAEVVLLRAVAGEMVDEAVEEGMRAAGW